MTSYPIEDQLPRLIITYFSKTFMRQHWCSPYQQVFETNPIRCLLHAARLLSRIDPLLQIFDTDLATGLCTTTKQCRNTWNCTCASIPDQYAIVLCFPCIYLILE